LADCHFNVGGQFLALRYARNRAAINQQIDALDALHRRQRSTNGGVVGRLLDGGVKFQQDNRPLLIGSDVLAVRRPRSFVLP